MAPYIWASKTRSAKLQSLNCPSLSVVRNSLHDLGETFFICWITLPADLKNWDFKKKPKRILLLTIKKLRFWFYQSLIEKSYDFETSLNCGKIGKDYANVTVKGVHVFFLLRSPM